MKFLCDSCGTKYSIADDRVRGRVLKIRCKKCDFVITVREDQAAAAAAVQLPNDDELDRALDKFAGDGPSESTVVGGLSGKGLAGMGGSDITGPNAKAEPDDWYISFDGEQEGPLSLEGAIKRIRQEASTDKEAHAWRPGFLVWLPIEEVPELEAGRMVASQPPRVPVSAMQAKPIGASSNGPGTSGGSRGGAVANHIARDPSGPRAALSVSAGAPSDKLPSRGSGAVQAPTSSTAASTLSSGRMEVRSQGAPPIPAAAVSMFPKAQSSPEEAAALAPAPMFQTSSASPAPDAPDLMISNEASGLVNLAHLTAAAMGRPTGPVMMNGHTGRQPRFQSEPIASLDLPNDLPFNAASSAPVVVMSGAAQGGTSPIFKWAALFALLLSAGLGGGVWYLLTHRPAPDTIIVTEPSRRVDDAPITAIDPSMPHPVAGDPKKGATAPIAKKTAATRPTGPVTGPVKPGDNLSGSQRALADLYKDGGDRATPHDVPGGGASRAGGGGQVSQSAILAVVTANRRALNLCYDRVLKHDSTLKRARVVANVAVGISGRVTSVTIADPQYSGSEIGQCIVQAVKRWTFPSSDAQYETELPFVLQAE